MLNELRAGLEAWAWPLLMAGLAAAATALVFRLLLALLRRLTNPEGTARMFVDAAAPAFGTFLALVALSTALLAGGDPPLLAEAKDLLTLLLIGSMTWVAVRCTSAVGDLIVRMNPADGERWRSARKVETQTRFLVRGLIVLLVIIGIGVALMTFDAVKQLGASLLVYPVVNPVKYKAILDSCENACVWHPKSFWNRRSASF